MTMSSVLVIYQQGLHARGLARILSALGRLPVRLSTCTFEQETDRPQPLEQDIEALLARTDRLVIAGATLNLLRQTVELDDRRPLCALVLYALAMGIAVSAVRETIDPRLYLPLKGQSSVQFGRRIDELLSELASLGIDIVPESALASMDGCRPAQAIVTLKDVQQAAAQGDPISASFGGRFTPAAKDWLREYALRQTTQEKV
ncbi:hypothetical protein JHU04_001216 [Brenneria sp. 4F2]|nr:hypothetical protein [Brenneria bubanii]